MKDEEAAPILSFLARHCARPEFVCRFRWRNGSIALWDNRCVQHFAINDYNGFRRRVHKITIASDDVPH